MNKCFGSIFCFFLFYCVIVEKVDFLENPILGNYLYFNKIVSIALVYFCIVAFFYPIIELRFRIIDVILILFLFYIFIHSIVFKVQFIPQYYSQILLLILVFLCSQFFILEASILPIILSIFLCFGIYESILGISFLYQNSGYITLNNMQPKGTFYNSGPYAIYLSVHFVLASIILLNFKKENLVSNKYLIWLSITSIITVGLVLPFTNSRTAWISSIFGITFSICQKYKLIEKFNIHIKSKLKRLTLISFISILLFFTFKQAYQFKEASANGRLLTWKVSMLMAKESPVFGKGFNYFPKFYDNYQAKYFIEPRPENEKYLAGKNFSAFNDYIQILIEYGLIGLILFVGLIFFGFYKNKSIYKGLFFACCIGCLSSYILEGIPTQLNFYFSLMLCSITSFTLKKLRVPQIYIKYLLINTLLLSVYIFYKTIEYENVEKKCFLAEQLYMDGKYQSSINIYNELFETIKIDGSKLMIYGKGLALNGNHSKAIDMFKLAQKYIADPFLCNNLGLSYQANKSWINAEKQFKLSSRMIPNLLYPKYLLARLYIEKKDSINAKIAANVILNSDVKIISEATNEMKIEMKNYLLLVK